MNRQSNLYTIIYIVVLVVVVGVALALTSLSLQQKQTDNINADKMRQILAAVHVSTQNPKIDFARYIVSQPVVDSQGKTLADTGAFDVDVDAQSKLPADSRHLPVYVCRLDNGDIKYIIPVSGAGLWGPIWGYLSLDSDATTVYGAYFAHASETPGLGAEIEKPDFQNEFVGKRIYKNGKFLPVAVVKSGQHPVNDADYVDGVSGGTITSKGVGAMLDNCIAPYAAWLDSLKQK